MIAKEEGRHVLTERVTGGERAPLFWKIYLTYPLLSHLEPLLCGSENCMGKGQGVGGVVGGGEHGEPLLHSVMTTHGAEGRPQPSRVLLEKQRPVFSWILPGLIHFYLTPSWHTPPSLPWLPDQNTSP